MASSRRDNRIAVFTKNHLAYLKSAHAISQEDPGRRMTFRAQRSWARAKTELEKSGVLELYIAPVDGDGLVTHAALLQEVVLSPVRGDPDTERVLGEQLAETEGEGLWGTGTSSVSTLYSMSNCVRLPRPVPMDSLVKAVDGQPLSRDYKYSYSVVEEMDLELEFGDVRQPEELPESAFIEGATRRTVVNGFERKAKARLQCVHIHGTRCHVCEMDFEQTYGELGRGFIHVHHRKGLAAQKKKHTVDPRKDLVPVCPNCHAMLHRGEPPLTPAKLRKIMKEVRKSDTG